MTVAARAADVELFWAAPTTDRGVGGLLDELERSGIARLREEADRARATTARALLRIVCGAAFGIAPRDVAFVYHCAVCGGPHGKPAPVAPPGSADLHVSVARAGRLVLVAAGRTGPLGVDVECTDAVGFDGFDAVALTAAERAELAGRPPRERADTRAAAWVRKEALLKLHGVGLSRSPSDIDVRRDVVRATRGLPAATVRLTDITPADITLADTAPADTALADTALAAPAGEAMPLHGYRLCLATIGRRRPRIVVTDARPALAAQEAPARTATA